MTNNILFVITDQERHLGWLPPELLDRLPNRRRLFEGGMAFDQHYTHSSPCSPSRATLLTGQYVPEHGVTDNVFVEPQQPDLHTDTPTLGHLLQAAGYRTPYAGKWHLSYGNPDMERYGYTDWHGEDWAWTGLAGTGTYFDPLIAADAASWLRANAGSASNGSAPWCLTVGLVNPHDIHWYPADQPWYQDAHREETDLVNQLVAPPIPGQPAVAPFIGEYEELFALPDNFDDSLDAKPSVHKQWRFEELHWFFGHLDYEDERAWRRGLDYYFKLHELSDAQLGIIFDALDEVGGWDNTTIVFTSDHGDMCGAHGLVNKGPFVYQEIMHVPLVVRAPGITEAGTSTSSLSSSADLAPTIAALAGLSADDTASMSGVSLLPVLARERESVRDHVLFAQAQAWYRSCIAHRFALRGVFDGRYKYVRYYGVGGGVDSTGAGLPWAREMTVGPDSEFWDQEHELYDLQEDPGELVNLAVDGGRSKEVRDRFEHLRELERQSFTHARPAGKGLGSTGEAAMLDEAASHRDRHS